MSFKLVRIVLFSSVMTALLSGCGTIVDSPNQMVSVQTPGATGARCDIHAMNIHYVAYPPQNIMIRRMQEPLTVTCDAPGNRSKTIVIRSRMNGDSMGNFFNLGLGVPYDQVSGALYQYPDVVTVDFTYAARPSPADMPGYHAVDGLSPYDVQYENMSPRDAIISPLKSVPLPYKQMDEDTTFDDLDFFEDGLGSDDDSSSSLEDGQKGHSFSPLQTPLQNMPKAS
jgi:hypothetical protein